MIVNQTYQFRRLETIAKYVKTLTRQRVLQFYDRYISKTSPYRRKFTVQVFAKQHETKMIQKYSSSGPAPSTSSSTKQEEEVTKKDENVKEETVPEKEKEEKDEKEKDEKEKDENKEEEENLVIIQDPSEFKCTMSLYPLHEKINVQVCHDKRSS